MKDVKIMKAIDLFCGAGGMSLGFAQAGFQVLAGVDNWDHAIECYAQNFPKHETVTMDLQDWKAIVAKFTGVDFDVLIGGPPCQDFSEAGDQVEGDKAELTKSYARVVAKLRPKYFVMENVPRALQSKAYKTARGIFKRAGYGLTEIVLDASLCGVPQRRKRFFCIGSLANRNGFLKKTLQVLQRDVPMTLRDYVGSEFDFSYYYRHPRTYGRRGVFSLDEPAPTMRGCNRPLPRAYKVHEDDVVNPHALNVRALTFSERARVQMFPSDYKWTEHATSNEQMIGNAVPVGLAKFVGSCLSRFVQKGDKGLPMTFVEWLQKKKHLRVAAAGDNLSRYRRAKRLLINRQYKEEDIQLELGTCEDYRKLSRAIQLHLHRACALHCEYLEYLSSAKEKGDENVCEKTS